MAAGISPLTYSRVYFGVWSAWGESARRMSLPALSPNRLYTLMHVRQAPSQSFAHSSFFPHEAQENSNAGTECHKIFQNFLRITVMTQISPSNGELPDLPYFCA